MTTKAKILLAVIISLLIVGAIIAGYFFGYSRGHDIGFDDGSNKAIADQKAKDDATTAEREAFNKSVDAAKAKATEWLNARKFADYSGAYNLVCDSPTKETKEDFIAYEQKQSPSLSGTVVNTINVANVNISGDTASIQVSIAFKNPILNQELTANTTLTFTLQNGVWCFGEQPNN